MLLSSQSSPPRQGDRFVKGSRTTVRPTSNMAGPGHRRAQSRATGPAVWEGRAESGKTSRSNVSAET